MRTVFLTVLLSLSLAACGGAGASQPAVASSGGASSDGASAGSTAPSAQLELLCGRVSARLPESTQVDAPACPARAVRVFGAQRRFTVTDGDCHAELVAAEITDSDILPSEDPSTPQVQDGTLEAALADGTILRVQSSDVGASCASSVDHVLHAIAASLTPEPAHGPVVMVYSRLGHRLELDLPESWSVHELAGLDDSYQSAFEIVPPEAIHGVGIVVSAWHRDADTTQPSPPGARPALSPDAGPTLGYHPITEAKCIAYAANAEPRIDVALLICPSYSDADSEDDDDGDAPQVDEETALAGVRAVVDESSFVDQFRRAQFLPPE